MDARVRAEPPRGGPPDLDVAAVSDAAVLSAYEEDAARGRGRAVGLVRARNEREVASVLARATRERRPVLVQGARSSLTGGATPRDDVVLSTELMDRLLALDVTPDGGRARGEPGLRLRDLNDQALARGRYFPPVPTYDLCCLGGAVATNAAGAVTFKHGAVRGWVRALRVVLAWGDVLDLRRGDVMASVDGAFEVVATDGRVVRVPIPTYRTPGVKKVSCGYFARDGMDLVDLFIGAEGTLGIVTEIEVDLVPAPVQVVSGLASLPSEAAALAFSADVRAASEATWVKDDPDGVDVRAIELVDAASVDLVRSRGRRPGAPLPAPGRCAVLWEQELHRHLARDEATDALARGVNGVTFSANARGESLVRLGALLARHGVQDDVLLALPDDRATRRAIQDLREAVPEAVNDLVAERKRDDPGVRKVATDMAVPPERLPEWLARAHEALGRRGLAHVTFGHVSDGNLHVNVLARSGADAEAGDAALLQLGDLAGALGGAPLAEHGVGKSPAKQALLRRFYGDEGLVSAARTKRALDPEGILAPGNLFPRDILDRAK